MPASNDNNSKFLSGLMGVLRFNKKRKQKQEQKRLEAEAEKRSVEEFLSVGVHRVEAAARQKEEDPVSKGPVPKERVLKVRFAE